MLNQPEEIRASEGRAGRACNYHSTSGVYIAVGFLSVWDWSTYFLERAQPLRSGGTIQFWTEYTSPRRRTTHFSERTTPAGADEVRYTQVTTQERCGRSPGRAHTHGCTRTEVLERHTVDSETRSVPGTHKHPDTHHNISLSGQPKSITRMHASSSLLCPSTESASLAASKAASDSCVARPTSCIIMFST